MVRSNWRNSDCGIIHSAQIVAPVQNTPSKKNKSMRSSPSRRIDKIASTSNAMTQTFCTMLFTASTWPADLGFELYRSNANIGSMYMPAQKPSNENAIALYGLGINGIKKIKMAEPAVPIGTSPVSIKLFDMRIANAKPPIRPMAAPIIV